MRKSLTLIILFLTSTISYSADTTSVLKYLVRHPKVNTGNPPLILLLHGVGSNERDLFSFADQLPANALVISARAPIILGPDSYSWFHVDLSTGTRIINAQQAEESRLLLIRFISELKNKFKFDQSRIFMCGFSQGGMMSYSVALTRPDLIHGIGILSGRLLDEVKPKIATSENLKPLKVFIAHGNRDQVIPVSLARSSVEYLKSRNLDPIYKEHGIAHEINSEILNDLISWISSH